MFDAIIQTVQPYSWLALILAAIGLFFPEAKKLVDKLRGEGGSISLPTFAAPSPAAKGPTLVEATQAADTLQRHYSGKCPEAREKLQVALTHFYDPCVDVDKPPEADPAIAAQVELALAARRKE
jgi:hypothetical protein